MSGLMEWWGLQELQSCMVTYVVNWLIDESLLAGLLSAWSWRGQPVHKMTLYIPTKCQNVCESDAGRVLVAGGCADLTVSIWCQIRLTDEPAQRVSSGYFFKSSAM